MSKQSDLVNITQGDADINGGTIDGTVIGGSSPAAISGTTGQFDTSLNVDGTITSDGLTVGTAVYPTSGALSNRNLIINGAMQVAQRGTSSSDLGLKYLVADRFWTYSGVSGTIEQSTDAPDGFNYSLFWNRTNGGSLGTSVELTRQGYNPYNMLTYSMYVKGNFTSTALYFNFRNYSGDGTDTVSIVTHTGFGNYTDWTRVVLAVDCTGIVAHANNKMLNIEFGGFPAGGKITGVQLEAGDTATPFEHEPFAATLQKCRRYYQNVYQRGNSTTGTYYSFYNTFYGNQVQFEPMRTGPTVSYSHISGAFYWVNPGVAPYSANSPTGFMYGAHQPNAFSMGSIDFSQSRQAGGSTPSDFASYRLEASLIFHLDAEM